MKKTAAVLLAAALIRTEEMNAYIDKMGLSGKMKNATHIAWATGGSMVPDETREAYLKTAI